MSTTTIIEEPQIFGRFRLVMGVHQENNIILNAGSVFESVSNLTKFNAPGSKRFERVGAGTKLTADVYGTGGKATAGSVSPAYEADQQRLLEMENKLSAKDQEIEDLKLRLAEATSGYTTEDLINNVGDSTEGPSGESDSDEVLDTMSVKDLRSYAENNEIDLKGATKKEDILAIIKASN